MIGINKSKFKTILPYVGIPVIAIILFIIHSEKTGLFLLYFGMKCSLFLAI